MAKAYKNKVKLSGFNNVEEYGAVGDNSTDNKSAFDLAIADSQNLQIPAGTFVVNRGLFDYNMLIKHPMRIKGIHRDVSILKLVVPDTTYTTAIRLNATGRLILEDVTVIIECASGGSVAVFGGAGVHELTVRRCVVNGGVTNVGASVSHTVYGVAFPGTGTYNNITIEKSHWTQMHFGFLKDNADTSSQTNIQILYNKFTKFYRTPVPFNSPSGICDKLWVIGNEFDEHLGSDASLSNYFYIGTSLGSNLLIAYNHFKGSPVTCVHMEEGSHNGSVIGNLFEVDTEAIEFIDNNNSGSYDFARRMTIANNIAINTGTAKTVGTRGFTVTNSGSGQTTMAEDLTIEGNQAHGFEIGFGLFGSIGNNLKLQGNLAKNCAIGYRASGAVFTIENNKSVSCDFALGESGGGIMAKNHTFLENTELFSPDVRACVLINPVFEFTAFDVGSSSTTYKEIVDIVGQNRIKVDFTSFIVSSNSTDTAYSSDAVSYDGSSLSATQTLERSPGGLTVVIANNSGVLSARVDSVTARTNCRLSVHTNGSIEIGV